MSDDDLIRRGDALKIVLGYATASTEKAYHAIAALEPVAAPDPALRPTMTDMMVDPDTLDAFMEANPLPPDPAAIREALLSLPAVYAHQINTGVREVYDPLQRFYTMESVLAAITEATK